MQLNKLKIRSSVSAHNLEHSTRRLTRPQLVLKAVMNAMVLKALAAFERNLLITRLHAALILFAAA